MIDFTPNPIALQLGSISIYWYGIGYAVGLAAALWVMNVEARRRGLDANLIPNGMIVVAVAALAGGRLYHVIDQWQLYRDDPIKIILPPYSGLGAYGGLIAGTAALFLYTRYKKLPFWTWADVVAPAVFVMQGIARWGNFFNQELYGPPTNLPWGIAIDCAHRVAGYECPDIASTITGLTGTTAVDTHFHPLFLYESLSGLLGAAVLLFLARRLGSRLRPGDLVLIFFIWYATVRFALETLRRDNWTAFGIPVAQIVSLLIVVGAGAVLAYRHRPGASQGPEASESSPDPPPQTAAADAGGDPQTTGVPADLGETTAPTLPSGSAATPPP